jgi:hypothetical protein
MGFEAQPVVEAIARQSLKLSNPIHDSAAHRSPFVFTVRLAHHILAVAVPNALFGQQLIAAGIGQGVLPMASALPGSQFSIKLLSGIAFSTAADSSPVAVLHDISFSSRRMRFTLAQRSAARCSLALIAARYGF